MYNLTSYRNQTPIPSLPILRELSAIRFEALPAEVSSSYFTHIGKAPLLQLQEHHSLLDFFPSRVGVVFSGGQAPGGHNVLYGLYQGLKQLHPQSTLFGFLGGPQGVLEGSIIPLDAPTLAPYVNTGGFDLLGSGRTKIETPQQLEKAITTLRSLNLSALVIIGGDDSNTNAALLAEYATAHQHPMTIIGVPKTIDGDLQHRYLDLSFGFDTATKVYSELIGNILKDALSAKKYFHFIRLMGRSASHIALECALQTHPNAVLIGEELENKQATLTEIIDDLTALVIERSSLNKHYGCVLVPEGLLEFIPQLKQLLSELNRLLTHHHPCEIPSMLSQENSAIYKALPETIQHQLLLERDPHGNIQLSHIETEKFLIECIKQRLKEKGFHAPFKPVPHFLGYEGRSAFPTLFDSAYCYNLGLFASLLVAHQKTGYLCGMKHLGRPIETWKPYAIPLASMIHLEERKGASKPVIAKALVDLNSIPFTQLKDQRTLWRTHDTYRSIGPIQFGDHIPLLAPQILSPS